MAHLLALAPLDVWLRLLAASPPVRPRYWPRLAFCLFTSALGTAVTLPERLLLAPFLRLRLGLNPRFDHPPGVVVVLGYYRSGTTHLHNLLACDPRVVTPRWYQCLAAQGWWVGWAATRFILTPFLGQTRPQDAVGFGPAWPGEDDFALAAWGLASSLPGRFVFPSRWQRWSRWHDLQRLTPRELARWRFLTAAFCWKVTRFRRDRVLVLKTPSHTARVGELDRLFNGRVRFLHISREPRAVVASNQKMHAALGAHALEALPPDAEVQRRIEAEYAATEATCRAQLASIDTARVAHLRFEALVAEPVNELRRAYAAIGLGWSPDAERAVVAHLHRVAHDRAETTAHLPPDPEPDAGVRRTLPAVATGFGVAFLCAGAWLATVWITRNWGWWTESGLPEEEILRKRYDFLVWPTGGLVGAAMARVARVGSPSLGWLAAGVTVLVFLGLSFPITVINWNWWGGYGQPDKWWYHNGKGAIDGLLTTSSLVFALLGAVTAWRQASRTAPTPPGT